MDEYQELCKKVYDRLGWTQPMFMGNVPTYDTDYVLGKLETFHPMLTYEHPNVIDKNSVWVADIYGDDGLCLSTGEKPIIALLKLTLALDDAGILEREG